MRILLTGIFVAAALSGCATVKNNYVPRTEQISFPALNEVRTATIGEELLRQGTATTTKGVYLGQQNQIGGYVLSKGFYPLTGEDEEFVYTSYQVGNANADLGSVTMKGGLFGATGLPNGIRFSKEKQQTCVIVTGVYGISQPQCDTEYAFQFTERPIISSNNFQQTLIFSGRVGNKIRISYREFSGNAARPAFSNEAEYDLATSDVIAYRGARVKVIDANNQTITYEVLSNFNSTN